MKREYKNYNFLNIMRFIMAIMVVSIHTVPLYSLKDTYAYDLWKTISLLAVPFFFISSGFFLGKKLNGYSEDGEKAIRSTRSKIIKFYLIYTIIYLPLTIYDYVTNGESIIHNIALFFRNLIFIGEHFNSWILWYLLSLIYGLTLLLFMYKKKVSLKKATIVGGILYLFGIISNQFVKSGGVHIYYIYKLITLTYNNGRIFNSLIYLCIGIIISKKNIKVSYKYIISFIILLIIGSFVPEALRSVLTVFESFLLFVMIINANFKNSKLSNLCKYLSEKIYYWHLYFYSLLCLIYNGNNLDHVYGFKIFIECLVLSILFSLMLYFMDSRRKVRDGTLFGE